MNCACVCMCVYVVFVFLVLLALLPSPLFYYYYCLWAVYPDNNSKKGVRSVSVSVSVSLCVSLFLSRVQLDPEGMVVQEHERNMRANKEPSQIEPGGRLHQCKGIERGRGDVHTEKKRVSESKLLSSLCTSPP